VTEGRAGEKEKIREEENAKSNNMKGEGVNRRK
jgi:hypothetical protein